tara:strand:- start:110 stop:472 length:363 start_codon:yes stop_codon:yes gene_type:complete
VEELVSTTGGAPWNASKEMLTFPAPPDVGSWITRGVITMEEKQRWGRMYALDMGRRLGRIRTLQVLHFKMGLGISVGGRGREDVVEMVRSERIYRGKVAGAGFFQRSQEEPVATLARPPA